jgi:radical SAM protein with 4Fe4S-binding SPASM domain
MDTDTFKKIVVDFVDMGGVALCFAPCIGEPLLDPFFLERAQFVKRFPQIKTLVLISTLQWLHKFDIDKILEIGFSEVIISIALSGKERYFEFFGVDNYEQAFKNLVNLIQENKKHQNKININIYIRPTQEPDEAVLNHPDFRLVNSLMNGALSSKVKYRFQVDDWHGAVKPPEYIKKPILYPRTFLPCSYLYNSIIVFSNGKVGACPCQDFEADSDLILGDVKNNSLKELWSGQRLAILRDNWRKRNIIPDICSQCKFFGF